MARFGVFSSARETLSRWQAQLKRLSFSDNFDTQGQTARVLVYSDQKIYAGGTESTTGTAYTVWTPAKLEVDARKGDIIEISAQGSATHSVVGGACFMLIKGPNGKVGQFARATAWRSATSGADLFLATTAFHQVPQDGLRTYEIAYYEDNTGTVYFRAKKFSIKVFREI